MKTLLINSFYFLVYAMFSGSGLILLKKAMSGNKISFKNLPAILSDVNLLVGFVFYALGFITWMIILSKFKLNVAFPIATSLFFIVSGLGSYYILKESFSFVQLIGILFCLIGVVMVGMK